MVNNFQFFDDLESIKITKDRYYPKKIWKITIKLKEFLDGKETENISFKFDSYEVKKLMKNLIKEYLVNNILDKEDLLTFIKKFK